VEKFGKAGQATSDNIIWRIRFACWKIKPTDKHSGYKILTVFATCLDAKFIRTLLVLLVRLRVVDI